MASKKTKRKHIRPRWADGHILLPMDVGMIAQSRTARAYVRQYAWCRNWESRGGKFLAARGHKPPVRGPVQATITIDAYLTHQVPATLHTRTFTVRSFGEVLVHAAQMYARVYREDEKLGGESVQQRDARLRRQKKPAPLLRNRGFGPYIWGHDIGDLVFELAHIRWDGNRKCTVKFSIGS